MLFRKRLLLFALVISLVSACSPKSEAGMTPTPGLTEISTATLQPTATMAATETPLPTATARIVPTPTETLIPFSGF